MKRIAVFPGSFDPVTKGHQNIVERASNLFDEIIVAVGVNTTKASLFTLEKRLEWLTKVFEGSENVKVGSYEGLTVDYCKSLGANYLLRGVRNSSDFEYEKTIAQMTKYMDENLETVILFTDPEYAAINSTVVREIIRNNGNVARFVPDGVDVYA